MPVKDAICWRKAAISLGSMHPEKPSRGDEEDQSGRQVVKTRRSVFLSINSNDTRGSLSPVILKVDWIDFSSANSMVRFFPDNHPRRKETETLCLSLQKIILEGCRNR